MASNTQSNIYTNTYSDLRGVDFSSEPSEISPHRFSYLENMYRDYGCGTAAGVETVPGFRKVGSLSDPIYALHRHPTEKDGVLIHAGRHLYFHKTHHEDTPSEPSVIPHSGSFLLSQSRSRSTILDGKLYLCDGDNLLSYDGDKLLRVSASPYVPCMYIDGEAYEQKNILTPYSYEKYHLFDLDALRHETREGIVYTINYEGLCYVTGYLGNESTVVIPQETLLNERMHAVAGIAANAFKGNQTIDTLILPEGMQFLKPGACLGMHALRVVVIPSTVTELSAACFDGCSALTTVYLGRGITKIASTAFRGTAIREGHYAGTEEELKGIYGYEYFTPSVVEGMQLNYMSAYSTVRYRLPLHSPATSIADVTIDNGALSVYPSIKGYAHYATDDNGKLYVDYYCLEAPNESVLYGKTVSMRLYHRETLPASLRAAYPHYKDDGTIAVNSCTLIASFDGRLFLSGNPSLPGTVFYTARRSDGVHDPGYIGEYNRILDGDGATPVRSLLATPSFLLVLTEGTPHASCIYRHEGQDTDSGVVPRVYPVIEGAGEIGCIGDSVLFYNDPLFLSKNGLEAVEAVSFSLSQERRTVHRSLAVDARLCREELEKACFFRFGTYLGIGTPSGHVYLADGRERAETSTSVGYEWYYLSDIGVYRDQAERYRTVSGEIPSALYEATVPIDGKHKSLRTTECAEYVDGETVLSSHQNGLPYCYVIREDIPYLVDTDGECYGGTFSPATCFLECDGLLYFGAETGDLMMFNTDKRGEDGVIPRRYYSFNRRAYLSGCATKNDNCQRPAYRKTTLRSGGAVKLKGMSGGRVTVRVRTDEGVWRDADTLYGGRADFSETDFASAEFSSSSDTLVPLRIGARRWLEQQLYFVSEEYQRPFGIISITYRYRTAGRI